MFTEDCVSPVEDDVELSTDFISACVNPTRHTRLSVKSSSRRWERLKIRSHRKLNGRQIALRVVDGNALHHVFQQRGVVILAGQVDQEERGQQGA